MDDRGSICPRPCLSGGAERTVGNEYAVAAGRLAFGNRFSAGICFDSDLASSVSRLASLLAASRLPIRGIAFHASTLLLLGRNLPFSQLRIDSYEVPTVNPSPPGGACVTSYAMVRPIRPRSARGATVERPASDRPDSNQPVRLRLHASPLVESPSTAKSCSSSHPRAAIS